MQYQGLIGFFSLSDWFDLFSEIEKSLIINRLDFAGVDLESFLHTEIIDTCQTASNYLTYLGNKLNQNENSFYLGLKFFEKAEMLAKEKSSWTDLHFLYLENCKKYRKQNDIESSLTYALKMISISEQVSKEFIEEFGKNEVSHRGFVEDIEYLEELGRDEEIQQLELKAHREQWGGF